ncbi:MAG: hypothetical protein GXY08_06050 [Ruminococcus sp.]|nr:hypothetical protein [Ruminococcus sp.]
MGLIKKTAAIITAVASMASAVPSGTVFADEQYSVTETVLQSAPKQKSFADYDLTDFDTVYRLQRSYGSIIFFGDECLITNLITEPVGSNEIIVDPDPGEYYYGGSAEITTQDIFSLYSTQDHYYTLENVDLEPVPDGYESPPVRWHCTLIKAKSAGDIKVKFRYCQTGDNDYYLVVNDDGTIAYDIDHLTDLDDFATVLRLQNNFGNCMISGNKALLIEEMEGDDMYDPIDIATIPFTIGGTADYKKEEGYTDAVRLSTREFLLTGLYDCVYDDRLVKYHTMILTPTSSGDLFVDYEFGKEVDHVDLHADDDLRLRFTSRKYPQTDAPYNYLDVVDFNDYEQLQYILSSFAGYDDEICLTYGEKALLLATTRVPTGSDHVIVHDMDFSKAEISGNTGDIKIDCKGIVTSSGDDNDPFRISYCCISGIRPGDVTMDLLVDGAEKPDTQFELTVGDDYAIRGKDNLKDGGRELIKRATPGELVKYPKDQRQYKSMLFSYPDGYRINKMEHSVFFIEPDEKIGKYEEDIVVNGSNRYTYRSCPYGFVFAPSVFPNGDADNYVVSAMHMNHEDVDCTINVVADTPEHECISVDRNFTYYYPERRDFAVQYSKKGGISVKHIDDYSGRSDEDLNTIYGMAGDGSIWNYYKFSFHDTDFLLDKMYYMLVRTSLETEDFFSTLHRADSKKTKLTDSKYIMMYSFEENFRNKPVVTGNAEISDMFTGSSMCYWMEDEYMKNYVFTSDIYNYYIMTPTADSGFAEIEIYENGYSLAGADVFEISGGKFYPAVERLLFQNIDYDTAAGDINLDGKVNIADLVFERQFIIGNGSKLTGTQEFFADMDKDNSINGFDLTLLREKIIEKQNERPLT